MRNMHKILVAESEEKITLGDLGVNERIILNCFSRYG
jgi:hypothetical protein